MSGPSGAVATGAAVVDALIGAGLDRLVLSPGSRSAPVAVAAARRERQQSLRLHVRLDERSAGFLALGMAKASGRPSAVLCTSGTAAANLLPAVVEARYSGVPLLVLTADRPPEARGRGASQTIDQVGMFDAYAVGSSDVSPDAAPADVAASVRSAVALAVRARAPVHLNLGFRPPLVGATPPPPSPAQPAAPSAASALPQPQGSAVGRSRLDLGELPGRGVIIAGDIDVWDTSTREQVARLAAGLGWPIVWEATSGLSGAPTAVPDSCRLLADADVRARLRADTVITVGPFGLDRGVLAFVAESRRHIAVRLRPRTDPPDPLGTAEQILDAVPTGRATGDPAWGKQWRRAAAALPAAEGPVGEAAGALMQIRAALSDRDLLVVAPSLAIRAAAAGGGPGPAVLANRGANGIDGVVSTAWGAASAWQRGRTVAVLGDLALLHDNNGLLVPTGEPRPDLTLVVLDNNGGGIFGLLEQGAPEHADVFERVFGTPHDRDLGLVLAAAGVPVAVAAPAEVAAAIASPGSGVRAVLVPTAR